MNKKHEKRRTAERKQLDDLIQMASDFSTEWIEGAKETSGEVLKECILAEQHWTQISVLQCIRRELLIRRHAMERVEEKLDREAEEGWKK